MRTVEIKVFTFDELSEKAQAKVLEDFAYINVEHDWWDAIEDEIVRQGGKLESLSIGRDGECDIGCDDWGAFSASIVETHGEQTDTYKTAKLFLDNKIDEEDFVREIRRDYHRLLEREYEYLMSEEAIRESIEANELEFLEDGTPY